MKKRGMTRNILVAAVLLLFACSSFAGGYNLAGAGAKALAMSGAFRGLADDGSAMYWNPAGIVGQPLHAIADVKMLYPMVWVTPNTPSTLPATNEYSEDYYLYQNGVERSSEEASFFAGSAFAVIPIDEQWTVGFGIFAPSGLGASWDRLTLGTYEGYNESPEYPAQDWFSDLKVIDLHPTVGYKVNDQWDVGLGISFVHGSIELRSPTVTPSNDGTGNPLPLPAHNFFIDGTLDGSGWGYGANIGAMYHLNEQVDIGAALRLPVNINLEGKVAQTLYMPSIAGQANRSVEPKAKATLPLPMDFGAGVAYMPNDRTTLAADFSWVNWGSVDEIEVELDGRGLDGQPAENTTLVLKYESTIRFSLGLNYVLLPEYGLEVRAGYYYDPSPIPDETLRPTITDIGTKHNISFGGAFNINEKLFAECYYEHLFAPERSVEVGDEDGDGMFDNVPGDWRMQVDTFGIGFGYRF